MGAQTCELWSSSWWSHCPSCCHLCRRPIKRSYLLRSRCPPPRWCSFSTGPRCDSRRATECLLPAGRRNYTAVVSQSVSIILSQGLSVGGVNLSRTVPHCGRCCGTSLPNDRLFTVTTFLYWCLITSEHNCLLISLTFKCFWLNFL
jgi:hypothetical protein